MVRLGSLFKNFKLRGPGGPPNKVVFRTSMVLNMGIHDVAIIQDVELQSIVLEVGNVCGKDDACQAACNSIITLYSP